MGIHALYQHRFEERYDSDHMSGVIAWQCPNAEAAGWAIALEQQPFPGRSGDNAPKCRRTKIKYNFRPGQAMIIAYYKTARVPGVARVIFGCITKTRKLEKDVDGQIIEGMDPDGWHVWKVTKGLNFKTENVLTMTVKTATESFNLGEILPRMGKINADRLNNLGLDPEQAYFRTFAAQGTPWESKTLWYLDYQFLINPDGWNSTLETARHLKVVESVPKVYKANGRYSPTGDFATRMVDVPLTGVIAKANNALVSAADSIPEVRKPYQTASFSELDLMVRW